MVRPCLPFIGSGQNQLARHSERGKKTRQTEKEVRRQHVPEGSGELRKMEETVCEVICGAHTTPAVKEQLKGEGYGVRKGKEGGRGRGGCLRPALRSFSAGKSHLSVEKSFL